jgi:hypothetical protein
MKPLLLSIFAGLACIVAHSQVHERWDVKTVTDGFTPGRQVKKITVAQIEVKPKIPVRNTQPRLNFEKQLVVLTGTVKRCAHEADGDYHIEVSDGSIDDSTMVCEAVDPENSAAAQSPVLADFKAVRAVVTTIKVGMKVKFTGLLFQDKFHSPSPLRTRNFVEIHPILKAEIIQ